MENKRGKKWSIGERTDNETGTAVSVDQLQPSHPGLVTKFSGKFTSTLVWSTKSIMYNFSDLTYVHLMRRTSQ